MKIITIRNEEKYKATTFMYEWLYIGVGVFFGVGSALLIQGYEYGALIAFLLQLACSVWWYTYHLQRKKLMEVKNI